MALLHDAYTALLAGLTCKTGSEIYWQDKYGIPITIKLIDIKQERYIIRYYHRNGQKYWESEYQNGQLHGKYIRWYRNGQKHWEKEWQDGQQHGKTTCWYKNGRKYSEEEWEHGKRIE
jgi:antitoxin component YwqK of YwqJK toxin-antitoxin module